MPQISYRANLSSAIFPMTLAKSGRSVIIPGSDQNYDKRIDPTGADKSSVGIPQVIYMENVLPTSEGYQSVVYRPRTAVTIAGTWAGNKSIQVLGAKDILGIINPIELVAMTSAPYIKSNFASAATAWQDAIGFPGSLSSTEELSYAVVRGTTYTFSRSGANYYLCTATCATLFSPQVTFTDISGTVTGIVTSDIRFIVGSFNYLIGVAEDGTVYWSSTTTPTDFSPSLVSGAGSEIPNGIKSTVVGVLEHPTGFFIYTNTNVIAATYTGNNRYPWKFREIQNSNGARRTIQFNGGDGNSSSHILISSSGIIQTVEPTGAGNIAPEVSSFLERSRTFDVFDYTTNLFSLERIPGPFPVFPSTLTFTQVQIYFLLNRYIFISYGGGSISGNNCPYAIVYDNLLKRYGKLNIPHRHIYTDGVNIYFFNADSGAVSQMSLDIFEQDVDGVGTQYQARGVLVLGKFQYIRDKNISLEALEIECAQDITEIGESNQVFSAVILPTLDGQTFLPPVTPYLEGKNGSLVSYLAHIDCRNFAVVIKGAFDINTLQLTFFPTAEY
jgi:hypothetical protein